MAKEGFGAGGRGPVKRGAEGSGTIGALLLSLPLSPLFCAPSADGLLPLVKALWNLSLLTWFWQRLPDAALKIYPDAGFGTGAAFALQALIFEDG